MNPITHYGEDGKPFVTIELTNAPGRYVKMDVEDWKAWQARKQSEALFLGDDGDGRAYVQFYDPQARGLASYAARAVMRARPGKAVKYRNRDRTDLRRANLYTVNRKRGCRGGFAARRANA